ncbi:MAG: hypothetical protein SGCHY_003811 [Lobulomycetales sp.]
MIELAYDTGALTLAEDVDISDMGSGYVAAYSTSQNPSSQDLLKGFKISVNVTDHGSHTSVNSLMPSHATIPRSKSVSAGNLRPDDRAESNPVKTGIRIVEPVKQAPVQHKSKTPKSLSQPPTRRTIRTRDPTIMTIVRHVPSSQKILEERDAQRNIKSASSESSGGYVEKARRPSVSAEPPSIRSRSVQTLPTRDVTIHPDTLLEKLRPWGPQSHIMPKKGVLYRPLASPMDTTSYYVPKSVKESGELPKLASAGTGLSAGTQVSDNSSLFKPTKSTTVLTDQEF